MVPIRRRLGWAIFLLVIAAVCVWLFLRFGAAKPELPESIPRAEPASTQSELPPSAAVDAPSDRTAVAKIESTATPAADAVAGPAPKGRIFGAQLDAAGVPRTSSRAAFVRLLNGNGVRTNCDASADGIYEFSDLELGRYWISATAFGCRTVEASVELRPEEPILHKDFTLHDSPELRIKVSTPDGRNLIDILNETQIPAGARRFVPVATRESPGDRFDGVQGSFNNKFGVGHFWGFGVHSELPPAYMGVLLLDCDLPLWVSLVHHQSVLQSQRVETGRTEVEFILSLEELLHDLATIRLRVLDATKALPIAHAGVWVRGDEIDDGRLDTDDQGNLIVADRLPGRLQLLIHADGFEKRVLSIDAAPGTITDLGDVALDAELRLRGRCVDDEGRPRSASFSMGTVDPANSSISWFPSAPIACKPEGTFEITGLGRRLYALRTRNHDGMEQDYLGITTWVSGIVLVDLREGSVPNLEVRLKPASRLLLSSPSAAAEGWKFKVVDSRGFELARSTFWESAPRRLMLPPDRYRVSLISPTGQSLLERSVELAAETIELDLRR